MFGSSVWSSSSRSSAVLDMHVPPQLARHLVEVGETYMIHQGIGADVVVGGQLLQRQLLSLRGRGGCSRRHVGRIFAVTYE